MKTKKYFILCSRHGKYCLEYVPGWRTKNKNIIVTYIPQKHHYTLTHVKSGTSIDRVRMSYRTKKEALESLDKKMDDPCEVNCINYCIRANKKRLKNILKNVGV